MNNGTTPSAEAGFTLIEVVCALAILSLIAAILLPRAPRETSRARLEAYAIEAAALLKADRAAAIRSHDLVATRIDAAGGSILSGASGRAVSIPTDVVFDALLPQRCNDKPAFSTISFFSNGMSCGGTIGLTRRGTGYEIRVNWLTGGVDIVPRTAP
jgi:general secretion pathway protein H